jgi:hypothetical protein
LGGGGILPDPDKRRVSMKLDALYLGFRLGPAH